MKYLVFTLQVHLAGLGSSDSSSRRPRDTPEILPEKNMWSLFVPKLEERNKSMVENWMETLNRQLIFVGVYYCLNAVLFFF
jgi:hypothetical protein